MLNLLYLLSLSLDLNFLHNQIKFSLILLNVKRFQYFSFCLENIPLFLSHMLLINPWNSSVAEGLVNEFDNLLFFGLLNKKFFCLIRSLWSLTIFPLNRIKLFIRRKYTLDHLYFKSFERSSGAWLTIFYFVITRHLLAILNQRSRIRVVICTNFLFLWVHFSNTFSK
jgi:hypothetical protein